MRSLRDTTPSPSVPSCDLRQPSSPTTIRLMKTQLQLNIRSRGAMSGVLTMGSLDPAFAAATGLDGEPVIVDLRSVEFVEPAGACGPGALLGEPWGGFWGVGPAV